MTSPQAPLSLVLSQHPYRVGDLAGNGQLMARQAAAACAQGARIIVFPELALCGYPPEDLLLRPSLMQRVESALEPLLAVSGILCVVGLPVVHDQQRYNAAAVILDGRILGLYCKQSLPNYGVFDERRYFEPGQQSLVLTWQGVRLGILICEDIWLEQPIARLAEQQVQLVLCLNASPLEMGKQQTREALLQKQAQTHQLAIAYVNLVGGQDDLVFDGGSLAVNPDGQLAARAPRFEPAMLPLTLADGRFMAQSLAPALSAEAETWQAMVSAIRDYVGGSGFKGVLLGLSGGIDSAVTLALAVDALGASQVNAVMMPYHYTAGISIEDAENQARRLGVGFAISPIEPAVQAFNVMLKPYFGDRPADATEENLQARSRGVLLMALSNKLGYLVLTTGNKSEMAVGYATLYGDMAGGYAPLKDLYKTEVFALARWRNAQPDGPVIPPRVISRPPSAELRPDQTDQDSLPPYPELDAILRGYIEQDLSFEALCELGFDASTVKRVMQLVDRNEYKRRQSAPGVKLTARAFGRERRYPLVNGWREGS